MSRVPRASRNLPRNRARKARTSFEHKLVIHLEGGSVNTGERKERRGFASMSAEKQREIASKGGRAAHQKGTAHEFDSGEARAAGRKGGVTVSKNREHMAAIGRRGGEARGANRAARLQQSDREVGLSSNGTTHSNGNGSSPRVSGNSLGGEMRNAGAPERNLLLSVEAGHRFLNPSLRFQVIYHHSLRLLSFFHPYLSPSFLHIGVNIQRYLLLSQMLPQERQGHSPCSSGSSAH